MSVTYAFCSDITDYHNNRIRDRELCRRFPGSEWVPEFIRLVEADGHHLVTGDVAIDAIRQGNLDPARVEILSEQDSRQATDLLQLGAHGAALICFESPLFAKTFYHKVGELAPHYAVRILFQGTIDRHFSGQAHFYPTRIPIFHPRALTSPIPWGDRYGTAMVAGNKYWRSPFSPATLTSLKKAEAWIRGKWLLTSSPVKRESMRHQLHDVRLRMIETFARSADFHLYGRGWTDPYRLPLRWRKRLLPLLRKRSPQPCVDKQATLRQHRFAFAIENTVYPGYLTEKIIDCLAAGTIPLYLGDPLVEQVIPAAAFIDLRTFKDPRQLQLYLRNLSPEQCATLLAAGQSFIRSAQAAEFTFGGFAATLYQRLQAAADIQPPHHA